jgi:replicative DNA helicase
MSNQSHEIEYQLIGSVLKDGSVISRVRDIINQDNFHSTICQDIFGSMLKVHDAGLTIDQVTVGDQLQRDGKLDSIIFDAFAGRPALATIRALGNPRNVESYATNVQDYWGKRESNELASKVAYWSQNGRRFEDIAKDARSMFDAIELKIGTGEAGTVSAKEAASRAWDEAQKASQGLLTFTRTGLIDLDAWFRMRPTNLTIIAGRPGTGKTALLVTLALNMGRDKKREGKGRILFISMEMSVEEVTARFLSQISGVPATNILDGKMTREDWDAFNDAVAEFETLPIDINDISAMSITQIRSKARRSLRSGKDDVLIVDYLQLATSGEKKGSRVDEVGAVARGLKVLASESGYNVIAGAQLSRAIEQRADKRPILSDLRESGNLEQDANNIIFLHVEENPDDASLRKLIVGKHRNGATSADKGDVITKWRAEIMRFENAAYRVERFGND